MGFGSGIFHWGALWHCVDAQSVLIWIPFLSEFDFVGSVLGRALLWGLVCAVHSVSVTVSAHGVHPKAGSALGDLEITCK